MGPVWFRRAVPHVVLLLVAGGLGSAIWAETETRAERARLRAEARREAQQRRVEERRGTREAKPAAVVSGEEPAPVYVFDIDLARTPILRVDERRYAILGLGQDAETGRQTVWVRSIMTNRIAAFTKGESLFDGPVKVLSIGPEAVRFAHAGRTHVLALPR